MANWLLIDGFNLAFRAFYGMPELTRSSDGFPTGALHGWVKALWRLIDEQRPAGGALVFFDLGGSQERLALHPEYKAQRRETPEALTQQLPFIRELTRAMGLGGIEREGVESDDLLAAQAVALAGGGDTVRIVSADKDFAQVVGGGVTLLLPPPTANPRIGWRHLDAVGVTEKFGVGPGQIADFLALVGDTSDNIPGLAGVGPKTAAKWLQAHGSLEGVLANAAEIKPERFRQELASAAERLRLNRQLTRFDLSLPTLTREELAQSQHINLGELLRLLGELEMKSAQAEAQRRYAQPELF
ncbi:5'-3' exonuclease [Cephaloticoccus capnophilus]|uniref:5'-3' exonuclease n=1 Tax=Cephaloticoccus capnophilus TaxID=1548208 RepID=A0A139SN56_9BACT|nr:5'-3' exonuclease H3TH domain-containing protein [Cephaloticoccus capnophilus]KXU36053.1 5'-3' exonuclease [Cephaloticoccus capnophilus]